MTRRDGEDDDPPARHLQLVPSASAPRQHEYRGGGVVLKGQQASAALHELLAEQGLSLKPDPAPAPSPRAAPPAEVDRGAIRRALIAAGVPERHLRWVVIACPSLEAALDLFPPLEKNR